MKFIKLCMIVALVASGSVVHADAEIERKNDEATAAYEELKEIEQSKSKYEDLFNQTDSNQAAIQEIIREHDKRLKQLRSVLGLPHDEPGKNWSKILLVSAGVVTLTAVTGGLAGGGLALLIKGTACTAAQLGGAAGGLVGAHGIGDSLYKKGDVDFDEVASTTVPRAAVVGGSIGAIYAVGAGALEGFDGGIGAAIAAYINNKPDQPNVTTPQKEISQPKSSRRQIDQVQQLNLAHKKGLS